jgi:hypothetical protein
VFRVRYEYHVHIKNKIVSVNILWRPTGVFTVRYEHHLHVKPPQQDVKAHRVVRFRRSHIF